MKLPKTTLVVNKLVKKEEWNGVVWSTAIICTLKEEHEYFNNEVNFPKGKLGQADHVTTSDSFQVKFTGPSPLTEMVKLVSSLCFIWLMALNNGARGSSINNVTSFTWLFEVPASSKAKFLTLTILDVRHKTFFFRKKQNYSQQKQKYFRLFGNYFCFSILN